MKESSWELSSRQFLLGGCSRQPNGRWSEILPRKWQVQAGPNFIKHNPICALILPREEEEEEDEEEEEEEEEDEDEEEEDLVRCLLSPDEEKDKKIKRTG
ncbi:hypothetical protein HZH68_014139 [Vespula germanica]|uniref:Uncharacterized protein n=1 Tax=Vespula germanica TaxID=30212 RepID=A0A834MT92_VESGE|nr:hypothetical protein HZH68_014139 [Vespula germanica]